jgi:hypothetical protein
VHDFMWITLRAKARQQLAELESGGGAGDTATA